MPTRFPRFTLRGLLLLFIPAAALLSTYGYYERQRRRAITAWELISSEGVDAHFSGDGTAILHFTNASVTDSDLGVFIPAFNGYAPEGFPIVNRIELHGSKASNRAIQRFRREVPDCEIVP